MMKDEIGGISKIKKKEKSVQVNRARQKSILKKELKIDKKINSNSNLLYENSQVFTSISKVKEIYLKNEVIAKDKKIERYKPSLMPEKK